jgi:hypothetical protein
VVQALHLAAECCDVIVLAVEVALQAAAQLSLAAAAAAAEAGAADASRADCNRPTSLLSLQLQLIATKIENKQGKVAPHSQDSTRQPGVLPVIIVMSVSLTHCRLSLACR